MPFGPDTFSCSPDYNMFSLGLNAKVALGNNRETVQVAGSRSYSFTAAANVPGGIFTQPSNIGTAERNEFRAIPEFGFEVSMRLFPNVRLIAGYTAIYWAHAVRAGNQIDPVLNIPNPRPAAGWVLFNEVFTPANAPGGGNPAPRFVQSDLWIHGANFGLEVRY